LQVEAAALALLVVHPVKEVDAARVDAGGVGARADRVGQGFDQSLSLPAFGARQRGDATTRLAAQLDNSRPSITLRESPQDSRKRSTSQTQRKRELACVCDGRTLQLRPRDHAAPVIDSNGIQKFLFSVT
jgi:hypothetical protein